MQSYEFTYNGYTINFIDGSGLTETADCDSPRSKNIIAIQRVSGMTAPEIRHSQGEIAGNHGSVDYLSYLGGRIISIEGMIHGQNEVETLELIEDLCTYWNLPDVPTPSNNGYSALTFSKDGEISKYVNAKIHSLPLIDRRLQSKNTYTFQVQFRCQDPRIYSTLLHEETLQKAVLASGFPTLFPTYFGPSASGYSSEESIENIGNWAAPLYYTINNNGITNVVTPRLTNVTRGEYQEFDLTIEPGDSITIDTLNGTAVDQDGNNILELETADSTWLYCTKRRRDTFRLTADFGDPHVTIQWRDTWISAPR